MRKKYFTLSELFTFIVVYLMIICGGAIGWVLNLIALIGCDFEPIGKEEILRGIGVIVAPLGAILGYISF